MIKHKGQLLNLGLFIALLASLLWGAGLMRDNDVLKSKNAELKQQLDESDKAVAKAAKVVKAWQEYSDILDELEKKGRAGNGGYGGRGGHETVDVR